MSKKRVSSYDDTLFASNGSQHGLELQGKPFVIICIISTHVPKVPSKIPSHFACYPQKNLLKRR